MNSASFILAKKYAVAFLHVFSKAFTADDYNALQKSIAYVQQKHDLLVLLAVPALTLEQKKQCVKKLLREAQMPEVITPLVDLLLEHQRLELLAPVCTFIKELYQEQKNIMPCTIKSSHLLSDDHLATLKQYLTKKTGNTILATPIIDRTLIAGIRAQSSAFLWEYSLAQQLRTLKNNEL